jgi:hypothetical protein
LWLKNEEDEIAGGKGSKAIRGLVFKDTPQHFLSTPHLFGFRNRHNLSLHYKRKSPEKRVFPGVLGKLFINGSSI